MSTYTIPYVVQQTPRGERTVDLYSRLLSDRIIYLGTEIDDGVANAVIAQLLHLASEAPSTPISLYINSPGGSITAMLAIYDAMQFVSSPVETTCVGQAAWTAAVLLAGGEPGRRQMLPHARVVLHQPAMSQRGTIPDLIVEADEVARVRALLEEILAHHTGRTADQVREDTDRDLVLPGQAAVDYGIADAVLTSQVPVRGFLRLAGESELTPVHPRQFGDYPEVAADQAARQRAPYGAELRATRTESWRTVRSRAPATAERISDDGSLRPRSTSERYCVETPARSATSLSRSPRSWRSVRSSRPTSSRQSGSVTGASRTGSRSGRCSGSTSPMRPR